MHVKPGQCAKLFERIVFECTVGIQPNHNLQLKVLSAHILQDITFLIEIVTTHLDFDAAKAITDFDVDLLQHEVEPAHPDQPVDVNGFAC